MPTFHEDWYYDSQLDELQKAVKSVANLPGAILEIGCWEGKSTIALTKAAYPESVICIDHWIGNLGESEAQGSEHRSVTIANSRNVFAQFVENMLDSTQGNFSVEKMDCIHWLKANKNPIKFCHLDASNDYKSVTEMIELLLKTLVPGGILCGNNYLSADVNAEGLQGGVQKAVLDLLPGVDSIEEFWFWQKPTE